MIVHLPPTAHRQIVASLGTADFLYTVFPNREGSAQGLEARIEMIGSPVLDFEWHNPNDQDKPWVAADFQPRDQLRARTDARAAFIGAIDGLTRSATLVPGGRPDRVADSLRYAREAVDTLAPGSEIWATVTLTRPALSDPQTLMEMNQLHRGISGIYCVMYDNAGFPSAWPRAELLEYLRLVGSQALTGRLIIAAHSDVRGLMVTALGATHLGTGVFKSMKQYATPSGTGGAQPGQAPPPTASYLSLPLLATLHGDNAAAILGDDIQQVESHETSLPNCQLPGLGPSGDAWDSWRNPQGNANVVRGLLGIRAIAAAEAQLRASTQPADLMEDWLDNAAQIAAGVDAEAFQTAGLRAEVLARPAVFREARGFLGI